ncbi:MFS transporter [Brevibacillus daliensis]|uniref:MFS transporter n=1 Tax=Brevibacillus daliensis TaxID=2892995 RepID=UPI001E51D168|nr:MFS transporter [Brevibacillus daliensis]
MKIPQGAQTGLWRNTSFLFLFFSSISKGIADQFASIAFVWLLLESGGNATSTSLLYLANILPLMVLGVFISPMLHKGKLSYWMLCSDGIRAILVIILPVVAWIGTPPIWLFFISAFLQSTCGSIYGPASVALLPRIIQKEALQEANALLQSANQSVRLLGLASAGVVVTLFSTKIALSITALLFLVSAGLLVGVKEQRNEGEECENEEKSTLVSKRKPLVIEVRNYFSKVRKSFSLLSEYRAIRDMAIFFAFQNVGVIPIFTLLAIIVKEDMNGTAAMLTTLQILQALGGVLIGLLLSKWKIKRQGLFFLGIAFVESLVLCFYGLGPGMIGAAILSLVFGMTITAANLPEIIIIQSTVKEEHQAQVFSLVSAISCLFLPLTSLLIGPLADMYGSLQVVFWGGTVALLCTILAYVLTPLRKVVVST